MTRRNFGSIRKLPSGRWQARYRNPRGKLLSAPETFATKGDASAWLARTQADKARGDFVDPGAGRITVGDFAERFIGQRVLALRTKETYQTLLSIHILPVLGDIEIGQLSPGMVRTWHTQLAQRHQSTAAKAYRLLRVMMNTAVTDELIVRNPCKIDGGGKETAAERPIATIEEVDALVEAMPERMKAMILLATWCQLRKGELCALRRKDIDLVQGTLTVAQSLQQLRDGTMVLKEPKSEAGRRTVVIPPHIKEPVSAHLDKFTKESPDSIVFTGEKGGFLRPHVLQKHWAKARIAAGRPDLHIHDLRHTGNTWAAATGASTKELMARMGHASTEAALRYQHATSDRDRVIAEALTKMVRNFNEK